MAVLNINIESQNNAKSEIDSVERQLQSINQQIVDNRRETLKADDATKETLRTKNQELSVQRQQLSLDQRLNRQRLASLRAEERTIKQNIAIEQRAARDRERIQREQLRRTREINTATRNLTQNLTIASAVATRAFARWTGNLISAAAEMETFRQTVIVAEGDILAGEQALERLLQTTVDLVGIDTGDLLNFYGRLRQLGLDSNQTISAITGVTRAIAEQGKAAFETSAVLVQSSQVLASNRITVQDYNSIVSRIPQFARAATEALDQQVKSVEDFRAASEAVGGPAQGLLRTLLRLESTSSGANLDSFNAQLEILSDNSRVLAAEIGQELLPTATEFLKFLNGLVQDFRDADPSFKRFVAFTAAGATGLAALTAAVGATTLAVGALNASINTIVGSGGLGLLSRLSGFAGTSLRFIGSNAGIATTGIITLGQAWNQIYNDFQRTSPFENAREEIIDFNVEQSQTARGFGITADLIKSRSAEVATEIGLVASRMDELREEIVILTNAGGSNQAALSALRDEYRQLSTQLQELRDSASTVEPAVTPPENLYRSIIDANQQLQRARAELESAPDTSAVSILTQDALSAISEQERINTELARRTIEDKEQLEAELYRIEVTAANARAAVREAASAPDTSAVSILTQDALSAISEQERINTELARRTIEDKEQLEAELYGIEVDAANARADVREAAIARSLELSQNRWEREREIAQAGADAINANVQRAGAAYANQLRQIASPEQRRNYQELIDSFLDQGDSLEVARERASEYLSLFATLPSTVSRVDAAYGQFNSQLERQFELSQRAADGIYSLSDAFQFLNRQIREASETQTLNLLLPERPADLREQEYFDRQRDGQDLTDIRREAAEQGREFLNERLRQQEQDIRGHLDRQDRVYANFYRRLGGLAANSLVETLNIQNDFVQTLLGEFVNIFLRITALKIQERLQDDNLTQAKILNQKRIQAEILNTASVSQSASAASTGSGFLGLSGAALGGLGLGLGILSIVGSLISGRESRDRVLNAPDRQQNIEVNLRPSSEFSREQYYAGQSLERDRRV